MNNRDRIMGWALNLVLLIVAGAVVYLLVIYKPQ
jgi:hypothetical protein